MQQHERKTLNWVYKRMINRITRILHILKIYFIFKNVLFLHFIKNV